MILVRNQIGDMIGGETGKFTCRKNEVKFRTSNFQVVHLRCVCQIIQYVFIVSTTLYINIISSTFIRTIY